MSQIFTALAVVGLIVSIFFGGMKLESTLNDAKVTKITNTQLKADNDALISFAKAQKQIYDSYGPILNDLKDDPKASDSIPDSTINLIKRLPEPQGKH